MRLQEDRPGPWNSAPREAMTGVTVDRDGTIALPAEIREKRKRARDFRPPPYILLRGNNLAAIIFAPPLGWPGGQAHLPVWPRRLTRRRGDVSGPKATLLRELQAPDCARLAARVSAVGQSYYSSLAA